MNRENGMHHSLDKLGHLSNGVFDRDRRVSAVEVVEVDVIDSQLRQRLVEGRADVLRVGFHNSLLFSVSNTKLVGDNPMPKTELGSKEDLATLSGLLEPMLSNREAGTE